MSTPAGIVYPKRTFGGASSEAWTYFPGCSKLFQTDGIIGSAMMEDCTLSTKPRSEADAEELAALLEAARRATWDALHGPRHLRSGRFNPQPEPDEDEAERAERGIATDGASRRS